jgi:lysophospholipase
VQPSLNNAKKTLDGFSSGDTSGILFMLDQLLKNVITRAEDVANWPNVSVLRFISSSSRRLTNLNQPFHSVAAGVFTESNSSWLELVNGGSNGAEIPLGPLLVKAISPISQSPHAYKT